MKYALVPSACRAFGLADPVAEHQFAPPRRWRFDWAFPEQKVALEIEGGVFRAGRHTRGSGYVKDLEKYSEAAARGWLVIRVTPAQVQEQQTYEWLKQAMAQRVPSVVRDSNGNIRERKPRDGKSYDEHQMESKS